MAEEIFAIPPMTKKSRKTTYRKENRHYLDKKRGVFNSTDYNYGYARKDRALFLSLY
ncbi:MAG: hypothetical protein RIT27_1763 [Pseudomonadota bacterium]|jgi:hypothetical protein